MGLTLKRERGAVVPEPTFPEAAERSMTGSKPEFSADYSMVRQGRSEVRRSFKESAFVLITSYGLRIPNETGTTNIPQ